MIECLPTSVCSWDFTASGLSAGAAAIAFDWLTEQGIIEIGPHSYDVRKHGFFSGHWTLEQVGNVIAHAQKPSAMTRSFELSSDGIALTVQAQSPFGRDFEIVCGEKVIGQIVPAHAFTRRAVIECANTIPEHLQLFSFWLAVLTWKRSAQSN